MTLQLGDVVTLKSGERCRIRGREFTQGGLAVWTLVCVTRGRTSKLPPAEREWKGVLPLTTHEIEANAV